VVDKTITLEQLAKLRDDGAEFEFDRRPLEIGRLDELISKLDALVQAQAERTRADLDRSQTQLEVLATLQALIKKQAVNTPTLDLTPIRDLIAELQAGSDLRSQSAYSFDIKRTGQGYLDKITATPIPPTLN